jgi:hypothetical protein
MDQSMQVHHVMDDVCGIYEGLGLIFFYNSKGCLSIRQNLFLITYLHKEIGDLSKLYCNDNLQEVLEYQAPRWTQPGWLPCMLVNCCTTNTQALRRRRKNGLSQEFSTNKKILKSQMQFKDISSFCN